MHYKWLFRGIQKIYGVYKSLEASKVWTRDASKIQLNFWITYLEIRTATFFRSSVMSHPMSQCQLRSVPASALWQSRVESEWEHACVSVLVLCSVRSQGQAMETLETGAALYSGCPMCRQLSREWEWARFEFPLSQSGADEHFVIQWSPSRTQLSLLEVKQKREEVTKLWWLFQVEYLVSLQLLNLQKTATRMS